MLLNNAVSEWKSAVFCHEETVLPYNSHEHYSILYSSADTTEGGQFPRKRRNF